MEWPNDWFSHKLNFESAMVVEHSLTYTHLHNNKQIGNFLKIFFPFKRRKFNDTFSKQKKTVCKKKKKRI